VGKKEARMVPAVSTLYERALLLLLRAFTTPAAIAAF
jgi:hypothetical protein